MKNYNNVLFRIRESLLNSLSYSLRRAKDSTENSGSFNWNFVSSIKCIQKQIVFVLLFMLISYSIVFANNITIGTNSVALTGKDISSHSTLVQFNLTWDNSWRTASAPNNWDAAWVFVKYRVTTNGGDGLWRHASLNNLGQYAPSGSTIDIGLLTPATAFHTTDNPGLGAFIYRSANGSTGTNTFTGVQLRWNYGVNYKNATTLTLIGDDDIVDIEVFAIEMVYVPQGSFSVGSGGTEAGHFYKYPTATNPYNITSEGAIPVGQTTDYLYYPADADVGDHNGPIPDAFPKGFNAFYCMKYEISQQQYVDFLNTLTYTQQFTRTANPPNSAAGTSALWNYYSNRNGIDIQTSGTPSTTPALYACNFVDDENYGQPNDGQWIACNDISWADLAAYLDWSGLRPMTELEYEKSCRGTTPKTVPNEYAWGTPDIASSGYYTLSNSGVNNEVIATNYDTRYGNAAYTTTVGIINGPLRVGIFAGTSGNNGRVTAGATYYGIMEMTGNLWERPVMVGSTTGRSFTGTHGNGLLNATGDANALSWPNTTAVGVGVRGGGMNSATSQMPVSGRMSAEFTNPSRNSNCGGRGVRSAPVFTPVIGQSYGGGIIFYIDGTGQHGLIAATSDQSSGIQWITGGSTQTTANNNTLTAYGTGQANTNYMIAQTGYTGGAAKVCDDYSVTVNGVTYSDWFLPSKDELNLLYLQHAAVGVFITDNDYWSSSEGDTWNAWVQFLTTGGQAGNNKSATNPVRAIRSF